MAVVEVGGQLVVEPRGHLADGAQQAAALVGDLQAGGVPCPASTRCTAPRSSGDHGRPITALGGPLHGTAYLAVIVTILLLPGAPRAAKLLALVAGVGGRLARRTLPSS